MAAVSSTLTSQTDGLSIAPLLIYVYIDLIFLYFNPGISRSNPKLRFEYQPKKHISEYPNLKRSASHQCSWNIGENKIDNIMKVPC